jgi:hypothetical protein
VALELVAAGTQLLQLAAQDLEIRRRATAGEGFGIAGSLESQCALFDIRRDLSELRSDRSTSS